MNTQKTTSSAHSMTTIGDNKEDILISQLRIATHNINGLKNDQLKLTDLCNEGLQREWDVIGVYETNITQEKGKHINRTLNGYLGFWSSKAQKIKGSGVCILLNPKWEKHIAKVEKFNEYHIRITLLFKSCTIYINQIYSPPNDRQI